MLDILGFSAISFLGSDIFHIIFPKICIFNCKSIQNFQFCFQLKTSGDSKRREVAFKCTLFMYLHTNDFRPMLITSESTQFAALKTRTDQKNIAWIILCVSTVNHCGIPPNTSVSFNIKSHPKQIQINFSIILPIILRNCLLASIQFSLERIFA